MKTFISKAILGFDEVGRGCLAGPVVVACVLCENGKNQRFPNNLVVRDSKKMSRLQRNNTNNWVSSHLAYGIGSVNAEEIDNIGIVRATKLAAHRARQNFNNRFLLQTAKLPYHIFVDGREEWFENCTAVIKGDALIPAISLASIVAKVYRDSLMAVLDNLYEDWNFSAHVGYGTVFHRMLIKKNGLIPGIHRSSFCSRCV